VRCPACPLATGAFKRTRNGEDGGWAHVTCTLYHQNMGFDKPKTMDVVRWDASRTGRRTHSRAAPQQLTPLLPVRAPQNGCNVLKECAKGAALPFSDEKSGRPVPYVNNCWTSGGKKGKCG